MMEIIEWLSWDMKIIYCEGQYNWDFGLWCLNLIKGAWMNMEIVKKGIKEFIKSFNKAKLLIQVFSDISFPLNYIYKSLNCKTLL